MYTQCPECGTVFRVTATVLRAAQARVRCGVCDATFNALQFLTDDLAGDGGAVATDDPAQDAALLHAPATAPADERLEFNVPPADWERIFIAPDRDETAPGPEPAAAEQASLPRLTEPSGLAADTDDAPHGAADMQADQRADASLHWPAPPLATNGEPVTAPAEPEVEFDVDVDLNADLAFAPEPRSWSDGDDPLARTDEYPLPDFARMAHPDADTPATEEPGPAAPTAADVESADAPSEAAAPAAVAVEPGGPDEPPEQLYAQPLPETPAEPALAAAAFDRPEPEPAPARLPLQITAAVVLGLALAAQLVHHARESLIDTPIVGPPLAALYAACGAPVEPRWNLADYEVRQWGSASEEAPGALRLRASIVNHAGRSQPYPLLRVMLEDRFGGTVARREFRPAEYLPGRGTPAGLLAPGARADADLHIADPGNQAVGFELDVCLERHGVLVCGADPRPPGG